MYVSAEESETDFANALLLILSFLDYIPRKRWPGERLLEECERVLCGIAAPSALEPDGPDGVFLIVTTGAAIGRTSG